MEKTKFDKKIGIIGGIGPQATNFIYKKIIELAQSKYGAENNNDYPHLIIESLPIPDFISNKNEIETAKKMLVESVENLTKAGVIRLCLGSNTVHILLEELKKSTEVKFISMIELVAKKCVENGFSKVGLFGTPILLKSGLYQKELEKNNIELILPNKKEIEISDNVIREVLAGKEILRKEKYIEALNNVFRNGAQTIILGCTELPLIIDYKSFGNRIISSNEVLSEGIVDCYYSEEL